MKISKSDLHYLARLIPTWTFINISFNMIGLLISKMLNEAEYSYFESVSNEFVKPIVIQSVLFSICLSVGFLFIKNKKIAKYLFVALQFLIFHLILLLNLKIHHGLHFVSTFNNLGLQYLSNSGQYLVDILYLYFPIEGNFDNGIFAPNNIITFYLHWIVLNIVYYLALTWIAIKAVKVFFESNTEVQS